MITPEQYLGAVADRIQRSGARAMQVQIGPAMALVGLATESAMLSNLNYCVAAAAVPDVTAPALYDFAGQVTQFARANVVGTVGWNAASVVIAGLVSPRVHPDAVQAATAKSGNQFGAETRLVAVDLASGRTYAFTGTKIWGAAVQGVIRTRLTFCFPHPAELLAPPPGYYQQPAYPPQGYPPQGYPPPGYPPPGGWQPGPPPR